MGLLHQVEVLWSVPRTRLLLVFATVELLFLVFEASYGLYASSLCLVADALHHSLDVFALSVSLVGTIFSRLPPSPEYTYGYSRVEVLAGFTTGSTVAFISLFLLVEIVEQVLEPEAPGFVHVIPIALASLLINLARFLLIADYAFLRSERLSGSSPASRLVSSLSGGASTAASSPILPSSALNSDLEPEHQTPPLVQLAQENVASVAVMVSAVAVEYGVPVADVLAAAFVLLVIVATILPLMRDTGRVLLQARPGSISGLLEKIVREASTLEGVLEIRPEKCHFWTFSPGVFVGNIAIRVREDASEQVVLRRVRSAFDPYLTHLTIQIEKDQWT